MADYKDAGVDLDLAGAIPGIVKKIIKKKRLKGADSIGGFGAVVNLPAGMRMVMACDGVGTKLLIAEKLGDLSTVGIDLVAMNVNDIICTGLYPEHFLDYIGFGTMDEKGITEILEGIAEGCKEAQCALSGGESAQMRAVYGKGVDLVGFAVGTGPSKDILDPSKVKKGDLIIGIPSSGIHSNGYSLVNHLIEEKLLPLEKDLLEPTKIYVKEFKAIRKKVKVLSASHITGGGLMENIRRSIPEELFPRLYYNWKIPPIFKRIMACGVDKKEMFRVFNMGIGFAFIIDPSQKEKLPKKYSVIGEII